MKRIVKVIAIGALASLGNVALADEEQSFISEFPNATTYQDRHASDTYQSGRADSPFPSSVDDSPSLASEFPQIRTYADKHGIAPTNAAAPRASMPNDRMYQE